MTNRKNLIEGLLQNMHVMKHRLMVGYTDKKKVAVTPSQGFVLRFVAKNDSTNVKTIAQTLDITSSATTQLVDGLVNKGYLIRKVNSDDHRAVTLTLSKKAKKLFKEFREQGLQKMTELFDALTDKELAQYAVLNNKLIDSLPNK